MSDIARRLRGYAGYMSGSGNHIVAEAFDKAADAITQLEAENARLREALGNVQAKAKLVALHMNDDPYGRNMATAFNAIAEHCKAALDGDKP